MEAVMASELAQLESRTTEPPPQEATGAEKEDIDFQFNGSVHLVQLYLDRHSEIRPR